MGALSFEAFAGGTEWALYPAGGGLNLKQDGEIHFIPFGTDQAEVEKLARKLWGEPAHSGSLEECGAGPMDYDAFENSMTLHFQEEAFEGWFMEQGAAIETSSGLGLGSTLSDVRATLFHEIEVEETTLGHEFWSESLFGIVSGPEETDVVEALWSGVSCLFR
ncbi:hypothetical protein [Pelagibacterium limicola]|uniref:hypothetical protein n=1 Tax=Pelagibacterium limicola TaxID=2791022 RepID=UPI0018AFF436|nr:hypothetical protein [Pelagibacterium limicola]